jgi:Cu-processing system permease protein
MNTLKITRYQVTDVLRSGWLGAYALFFLLATDALFRFGGDGPRVIASLMNVVLVIVPLVGVVLGAMYLYGAREYIELLLSQPIRRRSLFGGLYAGLVLPLAGAFAAGVTLPFVLHGGTADGGGTALAILLLAGGLLTAVFVALSFAIALGSEDRVRGLGAAIALWLLFAVLYNGIVLIVIQLFAEYPLQHAVIAMSLLNPIDLGRILLLLQLDISALMGFTGAVFARFFGSGAGRAITVTALLAWFAVPYVLAHRAFLRKNF